MKSDQTVKSGSEGDQKTEESFWSSNEQASRRPITPLLPDIQSNGSNGSEATEDLISTLSLLVVLAVTFSLVAAALNGLLICVFVAVGGFLGSLLVIWMRGRSETTQVVPRASESDKSRFKKVA